MYTIHLAKEPFKFSCSHFTILSSEKAERLHGHNYQVSVDVSVRELDSRLGFAFDFNDIKPRIKALCEALDERILLPTQSPYLKLTHHADDIQVEFNTKKYVFPTEDTALLPLCNITAEELSRHLCETLSDAMQPMQYWTSIQVQVEETRGQGVSYRVQR